MEADTILRVRNLTTVFPLKEGLLRAVEDVSFDLAANTVLGIIGESGCGKSVMAQSIMRIVPQPGRVQGRILLRMPTGDVDLASLATDGKTMRSLRGRAMSMIFQEPMTSLSPIHTIRNQIVEAVRIHRDVSRKQASDVAGQMLERVGVGHPKRILDSYPFQLSGGLRQRAMIAMALCGRPAILIADEPTTALDVTVQAQLLDLLKELQRTLGMSVLYITHNLGVVADLAHEVAVMYLGRIVEHADVARIYEDPLHPYTTELMRSIPSVGRKKRSRLHSIGGTVPLPIDLPPMCGFAPRCSRAIAGVCDRHVPPLMEIAPGHQVRCFAVLRERGLLVDGME